MTSKQHRGSLDVGWGPVLITGGPHKGRVGYYDDDNHNGAIVYFGDPLLGGYCIVSYRFIKYATLDALLRRREEIKIAITPLKRNASLPLECKYDLLLELMYVEGIIGDRMFFARYGEPTTDGRKIFASYSSKDKWFVLRIVDDLRKLGHDVWMDETKIKIGQSIPKTIQKGIDDADFMIVFLSPHSVFSHWVEIEWVSKFFEEIDSRSIKILPGLIRPCQIPTLLKAKKYADFNNNYDNALVSIVDAIT